MIYRATGLTRCDYCSETKCLYSNVLGGWPAVWGQTIARGVKILGGNTIYKNTVVWGDTIVWEDCDAMTAVWDDFS